MDLHRIVEHQIIVTLRPIISYLSNRYDQSNNRPQPNIAYLIILIKNKICDSKGIEPSSNHQTVLTGTNNKYCRVCLLEFDLLGTQILPILRMSTMHIGAKWSSFVGVLLVAFDLPD